MTPLLSYIQRMRKVKEVDLMIHFNLRPSEVTKALVELQAEGKVVYDGGDYVIADLAAEPPPGALWKSQDGQLHELGDMNDGHVLNAVVFCVRKGMFGWAKRLADEAKKRNISFSKHGESTLRAKIMRALES